MTRAAPAQLLGLADRGHLGSGAVRRRRGLQAEADRATMFRAAALVFKDGESGRSRRRVTRSAAAAH